MSIFKGTSNPSSYDLPPVRPTPRRGGGRRWQPPPLGTGEVSKMKRLFDRITGSPVGPPVAALPGGLAQVQLVHPGPRLAEESPGTGTRVSSHFWRRLPC